MSYKKRNSNLTQKVGNYLLEQSQDASEVYETAGELYVAGCEACLFAANSTETREKIRQSFLEDLDRVREHVATWIPPTREEFKKKNGISADEAGRRFRELKEKRSTNLWG